MERGRRILNWCVELLYGFRFSRRNFFFLNQKTKSDDVITPNLKNGNNVKTLTLHCTTVLDKSKNGS